MNQARVDRLVSKLNFRITYKPRRLYAGNDGPNSDGKLKKMGKVITTLFKYERIEGMYPILCEARGYVEQLINEAIRRGPNDKDMMALANYYIIEKQYIPKLFEVLVPRYQNYTSAFTAMYAAPLPCPGHQIPRSILELKEHPYPPIADKPSDGRYLLHNVLLNEAKKMYYIKKKETVSEPPIIS